MYCYLKRFFICLGICFGSIIILSFIFTFLNYFNIMGTKAANVTKVLIPLFSAMLGSYFFGKKAKKNGWLEGVKFGGCLFIIFLLIDIILQGFSYRSLIFYVVIMFSAILGSIAGINKKE